MTTSLIYFGIPFAFFIFLVVSDVIDDGGSIFNLFCGFMLSIIVFLMLLLITMVITVGAEQEYFLKEKNPIYAIESNLSASGNFFLGSGMMSSENKYFYIGDYKDGRKVYHVRQDSSYIVESDEEPTVEIRKTQFKNKWLRKNIPNTRTKMEYKFTIPKESIKYDYNIDLSEMGQ